MMIMIVKGRTYIEAKSTSKLERRLGKSVGGSVLCRQHVHEHSNQLFEGYYVCHHNCVYQKVETRLWREDFSIAWCTVFDGTTS